MYFAESRTYIEALNSILNGEKIPSYFFDLETLQRRYQTFVATHDRSSSSILTSNFNDIFIQLHKNIIDCRIYTYLLIV